jgi:hypothetical protein
MRARDHRHHREVAVSRSSRSASHILMTDWRVTPSRSIQRFDHPDREVDVDLLST